MKKLMFSAVFLLTASACASEHQALKPGGMFKDCETCPEMVVLPVPGTFKMGRHPSKEKFPYEYEWHDVTINYQFAVGKFELLEKEYLECVNDAACPELRNRSTAVFDWMPAYSITWDQANAYVLWLAKKTGKPYRLLSHSEWEFAARAGTETLFWWGDQFKQDMAICQGCSSATGMAEGSAVQGDKAFSFSLKRGVYYNAVGGSDVVPANPFGLYHMLGNVREWVADCAHGGDKNRPVDGSAWISGGDCSARVVAGHDYSDSSDRLKMSRWNLIEKDRLVLTSHVGARIAVSLK